MNKISKMLIWIFTTIFILQSCTIKNLNTNDIESKSFRTQSYYTQDTSNK